MKSRAAYHHAYYVAHREAYRERGRRYRQALKADPVAYRAWIEKARLYKRRVFGWVRTYRKRGVYENA